MEGSPRPGGLSGSLLAVVAREELPKYTSLTRNFVSETMEVVLDRRGRERRPAHSWVTMERRRTDHRHRDITTDLQPPRWARALHQPHAPSESNRRSLGPCPQR